MRFGLRELAAAAAIMTAGMAGAESYVAKVYNAGGNTFAAYSGTGTMMVTGMSQDSGEHHAATFTPQGLRDLNPAGFTHSRILDSRGSYHVGYGQSGSSVVSLLWIGQTPTNLHPIGAEYTSSSARGVDGNLQVGSFSSNQACTGCTVTGSHACSWFRTASSMRRLHAPGLTSCSANDIHGSNVVGEGRLSGRTVALLWAGTETNPVNLDSAGFDGGTVASVVFGNQQGGYGVLGGNNQAVMWSGSAASIVNLHPTVFKSTQIMAMNGVVQVGMAITFGNRPQAILWHGSHSTWTNLHHKMPSMFWNWRSVANGIDVQGNITGYVSSPDGLVRRPVIWERMP